MRIGFVHPDLGIGGAERLVVDAALGLKQKGHHVEIWTSHHDSSHCFQETKDGTLNVRVYGDFFPRHISGIEKRGTEERALLILSSVTNPLLRIRGAKVLFYCHFPDKLLSKRTSVLKKIYRFPIDLLEEFTTGCANVVVVNSHFTASQYSDAFTWLHTRPSVLYPCINMQNYDRPPLSPVKLGDVPDDKELILSINSMRKYYSPSPKFTDSLDVPESNTLVMNTNRFERKKNIELVIRAFAQVRAKVNPDLWLQLHLVLAGGYDPRVAENVEHVEELYKVVRESGLQGKVSFIQSFSEDQRYVLLKRAVTLVYTPSNEHFGIGPLEGMYASRPVIAVNSGGPLETIQHNVTGFLCSPEPESFASAIEELVKNDKKAEEMGKAGRAWVQEQFSLRVFRDQLDQIVQKMVR